MKISRKQVGFSLVEIMVALVLGLVLTGGAIHLFIANKQTNRTAEAVSRLQENGRFALETIGYDLRHAGHLGCANGENYNATILSSNLAGFEYPADAIEAVDDNADDLADRLIVRYASANTALLDPDNPMSSVSSNIPLVGDMTALNVGGVALIADCTSADIFTITEIDEVDDTVAHAANMELGDPANSSGNLSKRYLAEAGSELMNFVVNAYEVKATGRTNSAGDPVLALFRNDEELIEGVESMQVQFGECLSSGNLRFVDWNDEVDDPAKITSVRFGLLLHSMERVRGEPDQDTYNVAGIDVEPAGEGATGPTHAADTRLRKVFSNAVSVRNRPQEFCND